MKKPKGKFSDQTKAKLFAWDNAVCGLTGSSLWVLDYGPSPLFHYDWADHVRPRSRGGDSTAANGISTSEVANSDKSSNGRMKGYLYVAGQVTYKGLAVNGKIPEDIAKSLRRNVKPEDWYLNRVLANVLWKTIGEVEGWTGDRIVKNPAHYPGAAFAFLEVYRRIWCREHAVTTGPTVAKVIGDLRERKLLPKGRLSVGERLLISTVDARSVDDLVDKARALKLFYRVNLRWVMRLDNWLKTCERQAGRKLLADLRGERHVSRHLREVIIHNIGALTGDALMPRDGGRKLRDLRRRANDWPNGC